MDRKFKTLRFIQAVATAHPALSFGGSYVVFAALVGGGISSIPGMDRYAVFAGTAMAALFVTMGSLLLTQGHLTGHVEKKFEAYYKKVSLLGKIGTNSYDVLAEGILLHRHSAYTNFRDKYRKSCCFDFITSDNFYFQTMPEVKDPEKLSEALTRQIHAQGITLSGVMMDAYRLSQIYSGDNYDNLNLVIRLIFQNTEVEPQDFYQSLKFLSKIRQDVSLKIFSNLMDYVTEPKQIDVLTQWATSQAYSASQLPAVKQVEPTDFFQEMIADLKRSGKNIHGPIAEKITGLDERLQKFSKINWKSGQMSEIKTVFGPSVDYVVGQLKDTSALCDTSEKITAILDHLQDISDALLSQRAEIALKEGDIQVKMLEQYKRKNV